MISSENVRELRSHRNSPLDPRPLRSHICSLRGSLQLMPGEAVFQEAAADSWREVGGARQPRVTVQNRDRQRGADIHSPGRTPSPDQRRSEHDPWRSDIGRRALADFPVRQTALSSPSRVHGDSAVATAAVRGRHIRSALFRRVDDAGDTDTQHQAVEYCYRLDPLVRTPQIAGVMVTAGLPWASGPWRPSRLPASRLAWIGGRRIGPSFDMYCLDWLAPAHQLQPEPFSGSP